MMEELKGHIVLVEGLKDKPELVGLGANPNMVRTIAGHMDTECEHLKEENVTEVIVLTDMDRRGEELAKRTIDKLNSLGIRHHNLYIRNRLAKLLNLRYWETLGVKVRRFLEENEV